MKLLPRKRARPNPSQEIIAAEFTRREVEHDALLLVHRRAQFVAVQDQERLHRGVSRPLVPVYERMSHDDREPEGRRLLNHARVEVVATEARARQAWKAPENGLLHSRVCERQLSTQGKTGLPGFTKPSNYAPFIAFAVELFDRLAALGWPRLPDESALASFGRFALESFPTSAWRSLGLRALPGKANTPAGAVQAKLAELGRLVPLSVQSAATLSHDELQALVAGLAGSAVEGHAACATALAGVPPFELDGSWREGFIVNPVRRLPARDRPFGRRDVEG